MRTIKLLIALFAGVVGVVTGWAQHGHLNAGASSTNTSAKLTWVNGAIFAAESGFVRDMPLSSTGRFAGFYNAGITLVALSSSTNNGGPQPFHPAPGSFIQAEIVSVSGPGRGQFGFWETNSLAPVFSASSGFTNGTFRFDLSDRGLGAGLDAAADPYGHLHGRRFSATEPGMYTVGFRAIDVSTHGIGGGSIHNPSDVIFINFMAVPEPGTMALGMLGVLVCGGAWLRKRKQS
jgi:hypothetical protein